MTDPDPAADPIVRRAPVRQGPSVGFVSLGCPKATVDSEKILTRLTGEGYRISGDYEGADIVVVNTCGFIDAARDESFDAIAEALDEHGRVVVTGCLGAEQKLLAERFPDLIAVTRPHDYDAVVAAVRAAAPMPVGCAPAGPGAAGRVALTPPHYAYLKVSEGCNHTCTFCIIPSMRGRLVSRPLDDVMAEAEALAASGVRELLVIAQDTSAYGVDANYAPATWRGRERPSRFFDLCEALAELGIWVRLHYVYPYPHVDDVVGLMSQDGLLPYLDVPFQHGAPRVLKAMRRPAAAENTLRRLERWRAIRPDLAVRSTFIVGFPGETDEDFETLLAFLDEAGLDRVGCFVYSPVEGARANDLPGAVPEAVARERYEAFMAHQQAISSARLARRVGQTLSVIVDELDGERAIGRSYADAPEIDGVVYVDCEDHAPRPGDVVSVRVTAAGDYDLWGERVEA